MKKRITIAFGLFWQAVFVLNAQEIVLQFHAENKVQVKKFATKKLMIGFLEKVQSQANAEGYLQAHYDTLLQSPNNYTAHLVKGELMRIGTIRVKGDPDAITPKNNRVLNKVSLRNLAEKNIRQYENKGYPFATLYFDSVQIEKGLLSAEMRVEKGHFYRIDSLIVKGGAKLPKVYLQRYLGLKPGAPYNEKAIREMDKRLKEIPFVSIIKPSEVLFTQSQSLVYLYVKKKNASSFNGIVGILPDANTGKTTITGDARIVLKNALGKAETFDLNWRKIANKTQDLKVNLTIPFLFSSPLGTDLYFKLFKRDTSFIENAKQAAITWQLSRGNYFRVFYNGYNSDILAKTIYVSTNNILQNADVAINQYGAGVRYEKLDYRLNPRKGVAFAFDAAAGLKELKPNSSNAEDVYLNEKLKTEYYNANANVEFYLPLAKMFALKLGGQGKFIVNEKIFQNELMRLGGIKTLRGFDEESIMASTYGIATAEMRFLFEENSSLFVFFDQCRYENNSTALYKSDSPFGFGAGVNFQVKTGVFSFTWALGKQQNADILFRNSKLHFGFINYF